MSAQEAWDLIVKSEDLNEQLKVMFGFIENAFENRDIEAIDQFLRLVDDRVAVEVMLSVSRATSRAKYVLTNWFNLRERISHRLGEFVHKDKMMRGLLDN